MSIDISSIQSIYSTSGTGTVTPTTNTIDGSSPISSSGVSIEMSQRGQLFSQLQSLSQSDPAKFKEVTADIAAQLKDAASSQTGKQADLLNAVADRFQAASQSGNASDLQPPAHQQGAQAAGHHHHHHVHQTSGQAANAGQTNSGDSVWQTVQSVIANALNSISTG